MMDIAEKEIKEETRRKSKDAEGKKSKDAEGKKSKDAVGKKSKDAEAKKSKDAEGKKNRSKESDGKRADSSTDTISAVPSTDTGDVKVGSLTIGDRKTTKKNFTDVVKGKGDKKDPAAGGGDVAAASAMLGVNSRRSKRPDLKMKKEFYHGLYSRGMIISFPELYKPLSTGSAF